MIDFSKALVVVPEDNESDFQWDMSKGWLEVKILAVSKSGKVADYDYGDYTGCVDWLQEGMGIDYFLKEYFEKGTFKAGWTYTIHDIEVAFTRGDGWEIDYDEDWDFGDITRTTTPKIWLDAKLWQLRCWWNELKKGGDA